MTGPPDALKRALSDRYRVERKLGEGGMATVYLASDIRHDRRVALKVLRPELAAVVGAERFITEIRTTANLQHPHILPLFDSGEDGGLLWYVMPYVDGESLEDRLAREKQLPVDEAVEITVKVAGALQAAHEHGVVHRDIKPANILLGSRGEPRVADFGIALAVQEAGGGRLTETGLSLGTPWYMSPEQATADRDPDARSDVYALGCVLYQMLTGEPPFSGGTAQAVLGRILTADPEPPSTIRRSVPAHVEAAVLHALEKTPADRFPSAAAFADALRDPAFSARLPAAPGRARSSRAGSPVGSPSPGGGVRWAGRVPWMVAALFAVLAGWTWFDRSGTPPSRGPISLALTLPPDTGSLAVAVSPDGRTFAVAGRGNPIRVRTLSDPAWRALAGTEGAREVAFAPDGAALAFVRERGLYRVEVAEGRPLTLVPDGIEEVYEPHWGADGSIAFVSDAGLFRVAADGGPVERFLEGVNVADPYVLPDGSGILFWYFGTAGLGVLDPATDSATLLLDRGMHPVYLPGGHLLFATPEGGLRSAPFDLESGRVTADPIPLMDGIAPRAWWVTESGSLLYQPWGPEGVVATSRFVLADAEGRILDTLPLPEQQTLALDVSPDGRYLAFATGGGPAREPALMVYDLVRRDGPRQISDEIVALPYFAWSPGSDSLAYAAIDAGNPDVFVRAGTGGERRVLRTGPESWWVSDWLSDGRVVGGVEIGTDDQGDLILMPPDPDAPIEVFLATPVEERDLRISPDGLRAAYTSLERGVPEVQLRTFPEGLEPRTLGVGESPRWSADGRRLYFTRMVTGSLDDTLKVVELGPGGDPSEPRPILAFDHWGIDVLPDGGLLLAVGTSPDQLAEVTRSDRSQTWTLVLDWLPSVRNRLGN